MAKNVGHIDIGGLISNKLGGDKQLKLKLQGIEPGVQRVCKFPINMGFSIVDKEKLRLRTGVIGNMTTIGTGSVFLDGSNLFLEDFSFRRKVDVEGREEEERVAISFVKTSTGDLYALERITRGEEFTKYLTRFIPKIEESSGSVLCSILEGDSNFKGDVVMSASVTQEGIVTIDRMVGNAKDIFDKIHFTKAEGHAGSDFGLEDGISYQYIMTHVPIGSIGTIRMINWSMSKFDNVDSTEVDANGQKKVKSTYFTRVLDKCRWRGIEKREHYSCLVGTMEEDFAIPEYKFDDNDDSYKDYVGIIISINRHISPAIFDLRANVRNMDRFWSGDSSGSHFRYGLEFVGGSKYNSNTNLFGLNSSQTAYSQWWDCFSKFCSNPTTNPDDYIKPLAGLSLQIGGSCAFWASEFFNAVWNFSGMDEILRLYGNGYIPLAQTRAVSSIIDTSLGEKIAVIFEREKDTVLRKILDEDANVEKMKNYMSKNYDKFYIPDTDSEQLNEKIQDNNTVYIINSGSKCVDPKNLQYLVMRAQRENILQRYPKNQEAREVFIGYIRKLVGPKKENQEDLLTGKVDLRICEEVCMESIKTNEKGKKTEERRRSIFFLNSNGSKAWKNLDENSKSLYSLWERGKGDGSGKLSAYIFDGDDNYIILSNLRSALGRKGWKKQVSVCELEHQRVEADKVSANNGVVGEDL
ncbi:MAG: hypothetical protein LBI29_03760 [Rickettsiales bacterium]|nr:hypothetical protein [Rickettsiales bacterium]